MSLRARSIILVAAIVAAVLAASYWLLAGTILAEIKKLNEHMADDGLRRASLTLSSIENELKALIIDYAAWDDTFEYFSAPDPAFIESNFVTEFFTNLNLDVVLILRRDGSVLYGSMLGPGGGVTTNVTEGVVRQILGDSRFFAGQQISDVKSGFFTLGGKLAAVSLSPVLTSENQGPSPGTMIFVRWMEQAELSAVSRLADSDFQLLPLANIDPCDECLNASAQVMKGEFCGRMEELGEKLTCRRFNDVFKNPTFLLRSSTPANLIPSTSKFELLLAGVIVFAGVVLAVFLSYLLSKMVLNPLRTLCQEVTSIDPSKPQKVSFTPLGSPEFQLLSHDIQTMNDRVLSAYQELKSLQRGYRQLLELAHEGICQVDADEHITVVNDAFCALVGYSEDELLGRSILSMVPADTSGQILRGTQDRMHGISSKYEIKLHSSSGGIVDCLLSVSPILDEQGSYVGAIAGVADLTQIRRSQQLLVNAQKLESIGLLAGGIAHDFNNLLVGIMGNAHVALEEIADHAPEREAILGVLSASEQAAKLTRQLLAYAGKGRLQQASLCMRQLLSELVEVMRAALPKNVSIEVDIEDGVYPVYGDEVQLKQTLMNLVMNASEAYEGSVGRVNLSMKRARLEPGDLHSDFVLNTPEAGEFVIVEVNDLGIGMTQQTLGSLFDPFFTTKSQGRGLGMSSVLGIVLKHGGTIQVHSQPGYGSTFRVMLPVTSQSPTSSRPTPAGISEVDLESVLIVDDEPVVRQVAKAMLLKRGYQVDFAVDGTDAVRLLESWPGKYDAMLLDMNMPGLGTEEILTQASRLAPAMRLVLMSGFTSTDVASAFKGKSIAAFLPKPFSPHELVSSLTNGLHESA